MGVLDGVADGGFGQCVVPRLSRCVSGGGLYYVLCNDVMGPLSTLLLSSTRSLFAERMYHGGEATVMDWPHIKGVFLPTTPRFWDWLQHPSVGPLNRTSCLEKR